MSVVVSLSICLILSVMKPLWSMHMSISVVLFVGLGRCDSASVSSISFPGLYLMVQLYCWIQRCMCCCPGGTATKFFIAMISRSLWSLLMVNCLPYMTLLNLSQAKTTDRSSLCRHITSWPLKDFETKAIGWLSWSSAGPNPSFLASSCTVKGRFLL